MKYFLFIFSNNIAPLFLIISLGYLLNEIFDLDIHSLTKLTFYIFVPALSLVKIYNTELKLELIKVFLFAILFMVFLFFTATLISRFNDYPTSLTNAFKNSIMFYNCGNFGLPLAALVFNNSSYALSIQVMILITQTFAMYSIGFYNAGRGQMNYKESIKRILLMPPMYAIILALILKTISYDVTEFFLWPAIEYMKQGLIPVALLTLGVQLSEAKFDVKDLRVYLASAVRLIAGPIIAYIIIALLGVEGLMARVLFVSSAVPSAVNTALIAVEFDNEPDFASQVVLITTFFSTISVTLVIFLSGYIF